MSSSVDLVGAVALLGFAGLSFVDGVWLHLVRFRLYARRESRREHLVHTGRAVLFPMLLATLFVPSRPSLPLWLITLRSVAVGAALLLHGNDTPFNGLLSNAATWLLPGSMVVALVHVALVVRPDLAAAPASLPSDTR